MTSRGDEMKLRMPGLGPKIERGSHTSGIKQGNAKGAYESMSGHLEDGRSTAQRSTGINPGMEEPIDPRMPKLSPA
jgi:hypothetical protein